MNQRQLNAFECMGEENRVISERLGGGRLRFNDDQRRRLAAKVKGARRTMLAGAATVDTP